jgi:hypothetical protein
MIKQADPMYSFLDAAEREGKTLGAYVSRLPEAEKDRFYELINSNPKRYLRGPRNFQIQVEWEVAKAIRANPDSVRITVKSPEGTRMIGERLMKVFEVPHDED